MAGTAIIETDAKPWQKFNVTYKIDVLFFQTRRISRMILVKPYTPQSGWWFPLAAPTPVASPIV